MTSSNQNKQNYKKPAHTYGLYLNKVIYSKYTFYIKCKTDVSKRFDEKLLFKVENYDIEKVYNAEFEFKNTYVNDSKSIKKVINNIAPDEKRWITVNLNNSKIDVLNIMRTR